MRGFYKKKVDDAVSSLNFKWSQSQHWRAVQRHLQLSDHQHFKRSSVCQLNSFHFAVTLVMAQNKKESEQLLCPSINPVTVSKWKWEGTLATSFLLNPEFFLCEFNFLIPTCHRFFFFLLFLQKSKNVQEFELSLMKEFNFSRSEY